MVALILTQQTEFAIRGAELLSGVRFDFPAEGAYIALAVFGITGLSAAEIIYYSYWCLEKGYGRYAGPPEDSHEWGERARGWISVMRKDVLLTAGIYSGITLAFYLLGAAILHRTQSHAANLEGLDVALAISDIFTRSFGEWSFYVFMLGAFLVLYSTYASTIAAVPRIAADLFERLAWLPSQSEAAHNRWCNRVSILLALLLPITYLSRLPWLSFCWEGY